MWEAKQALLKRWKRQRHNRTLRRRIAKLDRDTEEHAFQVCRAQWEETCNGLEDSDARLRALGASSGTFWIRRKPRPLTGTRFADSYATLGARQMNFLRPNDGPDVTVLAFKNRKCDVESLSSPLSASIEECECDGIALMADGRLTCLGTLQQLRDRTRSPRLPERLHPSELFRMVALLEKDFPLEYAIMGETMLEQVFLSLVGADKGQCTTSR
ncbi:hypothetical protein HPB52_006231 [Rhipicephalus sanguineus]|uniref:Uncharacterized protein n=1 Tax=Rhipicephalus sanguineus TaxID=34632 RepID=A0A9D4PH82_RHISA|nr:hypothetical protein HPB52_006231 [Rhipicephalus sanguineus]